MKNEEKQKMKKEIDHDEEERKEGVCFPYNC